jgi:hypothetical protein
MREVLVLLPGVVGPGNVPLRLRVRRHRQEVQQQAGECMGRWEGEKCLLTQSDRWMVSCDRYVVNSVLCDRYVVNSVSCHRYVANSVSCDRYVVNSVSYNSYVVNFVSYDIRVSYDRTQKIGSVLFLVCCVVQHPSSVGLCN